MKKCHIVVPYSQGLCESYNTISSKYGVQVHFKGGNTLKNLLMFHKDKKAITKQSSIIYQFKCDKPECDDEHIGESARTFEEQYKDHLKAPSPIFEHQNTRGHTTTVNNLKIIHREVQNMARATTLPLTEILVSTICHTSGTKFFFHLRTKNRIKDLNTTTSVLQQVYQYNWPLHWNICASWGFTIK